MFRSSLACFLIFLACSCGRQDVKPAGTSYFDIEAFFDKEIEALTLRKAGVLKSIVLDGKKDIVRMPAVDWKKELEIFRSIQLNKPAYNGKFQVQTADSGAENRIRYIALEEKIPVRDFQLIRINNIPRTIKLKLAENSLVYRSSLDLAYEVNKGYSVSGTQQLKGRSPSAFSVSALFEP